jgi:hypothetical protein
MMRRSSLLLLVLLTGCAQVREPVGGAKDEAPPELIQAVPANGSVNFAGDRVLLHFDERIRLDRVRERLLISPPLDRAPQVTVENGRDVRILFQAPLAANTTYTINIGETVVDLSEGNVASGLTYVLSTGPELDSLHVQGVVVNALTGMPEADALVLLHRAQDTASVRTGMPAYFTRTDKQGAFSLTHIREDEYQLFALRDQNANYRFDLPNEQVAFERGTVELTRNTPHALRLFREKAHSQAVLDARVQPDRAWQLILARAADSLRLVSVDRTGGVLTWQSEWSAGRDTVLFWPSDTTLLTDQRFALVDTIGIVDTLTYRPRERMPFNPDVKRADDAATGAPGLKASRPIAAVDADRLVLRSGEQRLNVTLVPDLTMARRLKVETNLPEGATALLELLPGAIQDIYGGRNDTLRFTLNDNTMGGVGVLRVDLIADSTSAPAGPFVLQLLDPRGSVVHVDRLEALPQHVAFGALAAGIYRLKLIEDLDGDGRWSTGDLDRGLQPERVFLQGGDVNVRTGWDVAVSWVVADR